MNGIPGMTVALAAAVGLGFFLGHRIPATGGPDGASHGAMRGATHLSSKTERDSPGSGGVEAPDDGSTGTGHQGASPQAAIRAVVGRLESTFMQDMDFDAMFDAYDAVRWMSPDDAEKALGELDWVDTSQQIKSLLQMMLIKRWAKIDGPGALAFGMEQSQPGLRNMAINTGLQGWAREDPQAAYAWFQEHGDQMAGGMKGGHMEGIFLSAMARQNLDGAFAKLDEMSMASRKRALNSIAGQMARDPENREEFLKKLDGCEDPAVRNDALQRMVSTWAWQDPHGAAKFLESRELDAEVAGKMKDDVMRSWANTEPEAALAWRLKSADPEERGAVVSDAYGRWLGQDPEGAEQWLAKQPANLRTDELYKTASERLTRYSDYERAVTYAGKIENADLRTERMRDLYTSWKGNDETKARAWLERLDEPVRIAIEQE